MIDLNTLLMGKLANANEANRQELRDFLNSPRERKVERPWFPGDARKFLLLEQNWLLILEAKVITRNHNLFNQCLVPDREMDPCPESKEECLIYRKSYLKIGFPF